MKDIEKAFKILTHTDKVRIAGSVTTTIISKSPAITAKDGTMCTALGLLAKGNMNCAGSEISDSLFQNEQPVNEAPVQPITHSTTENGKGIIKTEAEKAAEEAAKRKQEEEEERRRQQEAEEEEERRRKKRENSWFHKAVNGLKTFGRKMVEEEEEEDEK
jgi:cell division protein FtsA